MPNGDFEPMYSTNNIWYDTYTAQCLTNHLEDMGADIDSYIGVPTADVPTDGMLQLIITGHESTEMAIGTITIQDGAITTNAMISWYEGNASLLESIVIVANGLTVQGWSAGSYCGTYQLVTQ